MLRALVLDLRISPAHTFYASLTLITLVLGAISGNLIPAWFLSAMWIGATAASAHRNLEQHGPVGTLQSVLGVPRRQAVVTRYLATFVVAAVCALGGAVVGAAWSWLGWGLTTMWGMFAVIVGVLCVGTTVLTLGYIASRTVQQIGIVVLAVAMGSIGFVPLFTEDGGTSTEDLVAALYTGPVSIVAVFAVMAVLIGVVGERLAERVYSRADL